MSKTRFEDAGTSPDSVVTDRISQSGASVVEINGKKFVSNLFWMPLSNPRNYMKEAREAGKKHHWDVVAIRKSAFRIQAGFVNKQAGAVKGMYSLASALAGQLGDQWIGAFGLPDGRFAVVAIDKGSVIPGYDEIVGRDEALEKLQSGINYGHFSESQVYAPSDFAFAKQELDISKLLQPKVLKGKYKLKQLTFGLTAKEIAFIGGACVVAVGLLFGYHQYEAYQERRAEQERIRLEQERQAALKRLNEKTKKQQTVAALKHPWASMPSAWDTITACTEKIYSFPLSLGGWLFDSATCDANGIKVGYKRPEGGATLKTFKEAVHRDFADLPVSIEKAERATIMGMQWKAHFTGDEPIDGLDETMTTFNSYFQMGEAKYEIKEKPIELPKLPDPAPGAEPMPKPMADWKQYTFNYKDTLSPAGHFHNMQNMNGLRITSISVSLSNEKAELTWDVNGEIYGK